MKNQIQTKEMIPEETAVKLFQLEGPEGIVITLTDPSLYDCKKYAYTKAKCYPNIGCFGARFSNLDYLCRMPGDGIVIDYRLCKKDQPNFGIKIDPNDENQKYHSM